MAASLRLMVNFSKNGFSNSAAGAAFVSPALKRLESGPLEQGAPQGRH
jgi:hypothetical protein